MSKQNQKKAVTSEWENIALHQGSISNLDIFPNKEDVLIAELERRTWAKLEDKNAALKKQLQPIFNLLYVIIPSALKELENQLKSFKLDKTKHTIAQNKIRTQWQDYQDDCQLILENAYIDVMRHGFASDEEKQKWNIQHLERLLDQNFLTAKIKKRTLKTKIAHYVKDTEILKQHIQRVPHDQKKFQANPLLSKSLVHLQQYIHNLDVQHFKLPTHVSETEASKREQSIAKRDAQIFQNFAHDTFHQKPILSTRLKALLVFIEQETENILFTKADYLAKQKTTDKTKHTLMYQTEKEKNERLFKLLQEKTFIIQGEQMDFTFLPAALQEFSKYSEEYQQEAVKKMQRVMNIPLENGSHTIIAGHQIIDKMKGYDLHKIRIINYNIEEDNLPRIILKPLPNKGDRERWCVVGFSDEGHPKRQYARFAKREVLPWPTDPSKIVTFNPPQIATGPVPTPVPVPGGNGRA